MRAAVLTTACVLAVLVVWSNLRRTERAASVPPVAAAPAGGDVAAPPPGDAQPLQAAETSAAGDVPAYRPATSEPRREHVVRAGETLEMLAARYYGEPARAGEIYAANRDRIRDPSRLHPGQTLVIP
jgi:nucleoid-associated protein YgaU